MEYQHFATANGGAFVFWDEDNVVVHTYGCTAQVTNTLDGSVDPRPIEQIIREEFGDQEWEEVADLIP